MPTGSSGWQASLAALVSNELLVRRRLRDREQLVGRDDDVDLLVVDARRPRAPRPRR